MTTTAPLRLRFITDPSDIWDLAFWWDPEERNLPVVAFLTDNPDRVDTGPDIEDPSDPQYDDYPHSDAATLMMDGFIRRAASHWQRVNPEMPRFSEDHLTKAVFLAALAGAAAGLRALAEHSPEHCLFRVERHIDWWRLTD